MSSTDFLHADSFLAGLPAPVARPGPLPRYNFIGGHNDPDCIPCDDLAQAAAAALRREGANLAVYSLGSGPLGHPGLRAFVARKSAAHRGIQASAEDILITPGSGPGIDLVNRLLIGPGDTALVEAFSFAGALSRLNALGANIVGMPLDDDGIRIDALAAILADLKGRGIRPKYLYTIPTVQNPTGSVLPLERRHALLALARQYGVPVFEDDCYADLVWSGSAPPALYALDPAQVIHIGSFSKSLAPALRLGFVIASWDVLGRMLAVRGDSVGALEQMTVAEYFSASFDSHVPALAAALKAKLDTMVEALEREFGTAVEFRRPQGGIFVWVKFPDGIDVRQLVKPAAAAGVAFNPGPDWAANPEAARPWLRLCFALPSHDDIREGVAAFARVCAEQTGLPTHRANLAS